MELWKLLKNIFQSMSVPFIVGQSFIPKMLGRSIDQNFLDLCLIMNGVRKVMKNGKEKPPKAIANMDLQGKIWNTPQIRWADMIRDDDHRVQS